MVTDILGREIKVGDIVCLGSRVGNHGSLKIRKVKNIEPIIWNGKPDSIVYVVNQDVPLTSTVKGRAANDSNMLVITDMFVGCGLHG